MRQMIISKPGAVDVLQPVDRPRPVPREGEVLVRVRAVGVNYADVLQRRGTYPVPHALPFTPGSEIAGVVEEVGTGAALKVGARVLALLTEGGYSEYVVLPAASAFLLPEEVSFAQGTGLLVQGLTAASLVEAAAPTPKQRVFVSASAGGVGSLLVQLFASRGAEVIAGVGQADKEALVRSLGAHVVARYDRPQWVEEVRLQVPEFDVILDAAGGAVYRGAMSLLAAGGLAILYGASSGDLVGVPAELAGPMIFKSQRVYGHALPSLRDPAWISRTLSTLFEEVRQGRLRVTLHPPFALADAAAAHAAIEARATQGKVVLIPSGASEQPS